MFGYFRRRSQSHRLSRRILVAMLAVALLPLAALTALVGADLTAINKSTVDAAHQTIVADAEQRESRAATDGASAFGARLDSLAGELGQVASTVDSVLRSAAPAAEPAQPLDGGALLVRAGAATTVVGAQSNLVEPGGTIADPLGTNRGQVALALQTLLNHEPELSAVWLYNSASAELTEVPVSDAPTLSGLVANGRIDPVHLLDRQLQSAQQSGSSDTGVGKAGSPKSPSGPAWSDIDNGTFGPGPSVTVWTGLATHGEYIGAELPSTAIASLLPDQLSSLADAYTVVLSPTGRWLSAAAAAVTDLGLSDRFQGAAARIPHVSLPSLIAQQPGMLATTLHGVTKDLFTAPLENPSWTLVSVVPDGQLAPASASLGDGIRSGVRAILILQVLPLAVVLGAIAVVLSYLFSRRLVGPVRALTLSAERLAQGHTDEQVPRQGEDEVGLLSEALERMRQEINTSRDALIGAARDLEGRVADRTAELRDRNEELVALNALGRTLTRSLDPRELLGGAIETVRVILPVVAVAGYTVVDGAPRLVTSRPESPAGSTATLDAAAAAILNAGDIEIHSVRGGVVIAVPVATGGQPLGALVAHIRGHNPLPDRVRTLLGAIADQVALALRTAQLSEEGRALAVLEERTRLAREIHDTLAQQLTGIVLQLEAAATLHRRNHDERAHDLVAAARDQARLALQEARRSVWNLRPVPLESVGLGGAVALEAERLTARSGVEVTVRNRRLPVDLALPPQSEVAVFRILQEALANAARHSRADHVEVEMQAVGDELRLTIRDNGVGFDVDRVVPGDSPSFGLVGMRERAALIGACFDITSDPEAGTVVSLRVPLERQVVLPMVRR
jgi:signal transduction histidine kinase